MNICFVILKHTITNWCHLPSYPMSDHFLHSISQGHWPLHIHMSVLTFFPLPRCTFSTQIRSVSPPRWSHPWRCRQNLLFLPCISTQVSMMILCYCVTFLVQMSVFFPLLSAPQGSMNLQSSSWHPLGIVAEGWREGGAVPEAQNSPLFSFLCCFSLWVLAVSKDSPWSLFPCHWDYFEHRYGGSPCLQRERASSVSKFWGIGRCPLCLYPLWVLPDVFLFHFFGTPLPGTKERTGRNG